MRNKSRNSQTGFTLIELLVVITLIGMLVVIALPNFAKVRIKAKEAELISSLKVIDTALHEFAQSNNGMYPGTAMAESMAFEGSMSSWMMRGVIGGSPYDRDATTLQAYGNFYFDVKNTNNPRAVPDRLVQDGALEGYPSNPFINYEGVRVKRPMVNIFGFEQDRQNVNSQDPWEDIVLFSRPYETARIPDTDNYYLVDEDGEDVGYAYEYVGEFGLGGWWGDVEDTADVTQWGYSGELPQVETGMIHPGDFSYIPFLPLQPDLASPDFMKYVKGYWLVLYGHQSSTTKNEYGYVNPQLPAEGYWMGDGDPETATFYERKIEEATLGARWITGTIYTELYDKDVDR
jgi:prepilin-type N-terminal cleavage/methylation domain-containing protein